MKPSPHPSCCIVCEGRLSVFYATCGRPVCVAKVLGVDVEQLDVDEQLVDDEPQARKLVDPTKCVFCGALAIGHVRGGAVCAVCTGGEDLDLEESHEDAP